eukprot:c11943_g1_i1.p1 GENE.c11943_g1_i1~~c11943_g1_i1.p1  ORF type:complete len:495 (+),score=111.87 c11943_g1_i1:126-1610(+)
MSSKSKLTGANTAKEDVGRGNARELLNQKSSVVSALDGLKAKLGCPILTLDDAAYNDARKRPFNRDTWGFPFAIAQAKSASDVEAIMQFAETHKLPLCLASGCHADASMINGSLCIDLCQMRAIDLDIPNKTVTVGAGCRNCDVSNALAEHNLAVPVGTHPGPGVAGLTLSGGFGYLSRLHGLAIDNLLAIEIVTPSDNKAKTVSKDTTEFADLFWAVKGGGGNFGVLTKLTYKLHSVPAVCSLAENVYLAPKKKHATKIVENFDALMFGEAALADRNFTGIMVLPCKAPVVPTLFTHVGENPGKGAFKNPLFKQAKHLGGAMGIKLAKKKKSGNFHTVLQAHLGDVEKPGHFKGAVFSIEKFTPEVIEILTRYVKEEPSTPGSVLVSFALGGAVAELGKTDTCLRREDKYWLIAEGAFKPDNKAQETICTNWVTRLRQELIQTGICHETTHVLSFMDDLTEGDLPEIVKLRQIKAKYDPKNLLHLNRNIKPAK